MGKRIFFLNVSHYIHGCNFGHNEMLSFLLQRVPRIGGVVGGGVMICPYLKTQKKRGLQTPQ